MVKWILFGLSLGLFIAEVAASRPLDRAKITRIINQVEVVESQASRQARLQETIHGNNSVTTGVKSRAELMFSDKTLTRLGANTVFNFDGGTRNLNLKRGVMLLQVPKGLGGTKIKTASVTAAITGTTIMIEHQPNEHAKVIVLEGSLRLYLPNRIGESQVLTPGKMVIMPPKAKSIPKPVDIDIKTLVKSSKLITGMKKEDDTSEEGSVGEPRVDSGEEEGGNDVNEESQMAEDLEGEGEGESEIKMQRSEEKESKDQKDRQDGFVMDFDDSSLGGSEDNLDLGVIETEVMIQEELIAKGELGDANWVIAGRGTNVVAIDDATLDQLDNLVNSVALFPGEKKLVTVANSDPFVMDGNVTITTNPSVTLNGVTSEGVLYDPVTDTLADLAFANDPFPSLDSTTDFGPGQTGDDAMAALFQVQRLEITQDPIIVMNGLATHVGFRSLSTIDIRPNLYTFAPLDGMHFASEGNINIDPGVDFSNANLELDFYTREFGSIVDFKGSVTNLKELNIDSGGGVNVDGSINVARDFDVFALQDVTLNGAINARDVAISAGGNLYQSNLAPIDASQSVLLDSDALLTINLTISAGTSLTLIGNNNISLMDDLSGQDISLTSANTILQNNVSDVQATSSINYNASNEIDVSGSIKTDVTGSPPGSRFINLISNASTGPAIDIQSTAQIATLMYSSTMDANGNIVLSANGGGDISITGDSTNNTLEAGRVTIQNIADNSSIMLNTGTQIVADYLKIGATGANGQVLVGNTQMSGNQVLRLYANSSTGLIRFMGNTVLTSTNNPVLDAATVQIDLGVNVEVSTNNIDVYATNHNYNDGSTAYGNFVGSGGTPVLAISTEIIQGSAGGSGAFP